MTLRAVDAAEAAGADFVVCQRVADLKPISSYPKEVHSVIQEVRRRSERLPCSGCGEPILRDSTSPKEPPAVCTVCMVSISDMAKRAGKGAS